MLSLATTLPDSYYYPYSSDEETEAPEGNLTTVTWPVTLFKAKGPDSQA